MTTILDTYNKIDHLLKKLYLCTEEEEIDALFEENGITDYAERSVLLNKCMGVLEASGTPERVSKKDMYKLDRCVFVDGTWRLLY